MNRQDKYSDLNVSFRLSVPEFNAFFSSLLEHFEIWAPQRYAGRGRFSDTDSIGYGPIRSANEIVFDEKSHFSPKEAVFPVSETMFDLLGDEFIQAEDMQRDILVFARPCDINGVERLDDIFLRNGSVPDPYYQRRRERIRFVLMECATSFENCFCVSMSANRTDNYIAAIRWNSEHVLMRIQDKTLISFMPDNASPAEFIPEFAEEDREPIGLPNGEKLEAAIRDGSLFEHDMWEEYSARCIACGRCNTHCPTCSCFSMLDIAPEPESGLGRRRRVWAGCHIDGFTNMAGGHAFRKDNGSRMRFKTMHKIHDFNARFGRHMCVGCGRCDDHCPEYIRFAHCIGKVTRLLESGDHE